MAHHVFNLKYLEELDNFNEKIDIDELYSEKIKSEKMKIDVYNRLLARVHTKIKLTSRQKVDDQFCCFIVPEMMIGVPKYDQYACVQYLMDKLHDNNFVVKYIHPNCLFISWKHWIPNYVREEFKNQTGITIDGNGVILNKNKEGDNQEMKMISYENIIEPDKNDKQKQEFKNTQAYKDSGKLLYNDGILEKLQSIINKTKK
jgi:hypothetical protein